MVAIPVTVLSQNSFVTSGGEYSIAGKLPGDQVHPGLNITTNGGYIVWEDYWSDKNGLGIGAMRLQNDLSGNGVAFQVNSVATGDQEAAQVSMLNNGGSVFAWQGGRKGFQHIYSRFLSSSNSWITGDVPVNSVTNRFQNSPVIATLLNGNVAMAYVSVNQAGPGSLADVYFQMFTPNGNKIGGEVMVNQFTANNQRTPTVAALPDGRFVVGWVSEQERFTDISNGLPSVDIMARVFNSEGGAAGSEFRVNTTDKICAAPDFASAPDGGFMATWMEKDLAVRNNGWDIFARRFTSVGVGGNVTRVNTQLYGDQSASPRRFAARVQSLPRYLGQHRAGCDPFARRSFCCQYLNDDATVSGNEFQVNTTTYGSQMHQTSGL